MLRQLIRQFRGSQEAAPPPEPEHQEEGLEDRKDPTKKGRGRGFGGMSPEKRKEIAANGGRRAHANQTAHTWTKEEASAAGKKSGEARARKHQKAS